MSKAPNPHAPRAPVYGIGLHECVTLFMCVFNRCQPGWVTCGGEILNEIILVIYIDPLSFKWLLVCHETAYIKVKESLPVFTIIKIRFILREAPWGYNCKTVSPEMPQVKMKHRSATQALCALLLKRTITQKTVKMWLKHF